MLAPLDVGPELYRTRPRRRFTIRAQWLLAAQTRMKHRRLFATSPGSATTSRAKRCRARCPSGRAIRRQPKYGLYTEEINGTSFTAPRGASRRCWTYRIRPSAVHEPFREISAGLDSQRAVRRSAGVAEPAPLAAAADPEGADGFRRGARHDGRQRRSRAAVGRGRASVRRERVDGRPLLLRRRRRALDRAAARRADRAHGARHSARRAGRDLRRAARREVPRRARRAGARLRLRELRRALQAARARADRHERPRELARLPVARRRVRGARRRLPRRREILGQAVGSEDRPLAARHRRVARHVRRRTSTILRASTRSTR